MSSQTKSPRVKARAPQAPVPPPEPPPVEAPAPPPASVRTTPRYGPFPVAPGAPSLTLHFGGRAYTAVVGCPEWVDDAYAPAQAWKIREALPHVAGRAWYGPTYTVFTSGAADRFRSPTVAQCTCPEFRAEQHCPHVAAFGALDIVTIGPAARPFGRKGGAQ